MCYLHKLKISEQTLVLKKRSGIAISVEMKIYILLSITLLDTAIYFSAAHPSNALGPVCKGRPQHHVNFLRIV